MNHSIYRCHYRGHLNQKDVNITEALNECVENVKELIRKESLMTCALYYHNDMLYLYFECISNELTPDSFMEPLNKHLHTWPTKQGLTHWAYMNHIYYHNIPESVEDWKRKVTPELRRGRIAYLHKDKLFSYVYHHVAIVEEGLLGGDKYQSIALHEDILFSYFEEPKIITNIKRDLSKESSVIHDWLAVDPESHFIQLEGSEGLNFLFLPSYFAIGQEIL